MEPYLEDPIPNKPSAALDLVGITVFIVGFFLAVGSIRFTGWFVPITSNVFISYVGLLYLLAVFQSSGITCLKKNIRRLLKSIMKKRSGNCGRFFCFSLR